MNKQHSYTGDSQREFLAATIPITLPSITDIYDDGIFYVAAGIISIDAQCIHINLAAGDEISPSLIDADELYSFLCDADTIELTNIKQNVHYMTATLLLDGVDIAEVLSSDIMLDECEVQDLYLYNIDDCEDDDWTVTEINIDTPYYTPLQF